jgi:hypothetical protein
MTTKVVVMHDQPEYDKKLLVRTVQHGSDSNCPHYQEQTVQPGAHLTFWVHANQHLVIKEI